MAAGAAYVARSTVYHVTELDKLIEQAMHKQGFALVEAVSYCHTTFGRANDLKSPVKMMRLLKDKQHHHPRCGKAGRRVARRTASCGACSTTRTSPSSPNSTTRSLSRPTVPLAPRKRKVRRGWI